MPPHTSAEHFNNDFAGIQEADTFRREALTANLITKDVERAYITPETLHPLIAQTLGTRALEGLRQSKSREAKALANINETIGENGEHWDRMPADVDPAFYTATQIAYRWSTGPDGNYIYDVEGVARQLHDTGDAAKIEAIRRSLWTPETTNDPARTPMLLLIRSTHPEDQSRKVISLVCMPRCLPEAVTSDFELATADGRKRLPDMDKESSDFNAHLSFYTQPAPLRQDHGKDDEGEAFHAGSALNYYTFGPYRMFKDYPRDQGTPLRLSVGRMSVFCDSQKIDPDIQKADAPMTLLIGEETLAKFATALADPGQLSRKAGKEGYQLSPAEAFALQLGKELNQTNYVLSANGQTIEQNKQEMAYMIGANAFLATGREYLTLMALYNDGIRPSGVDVLQNKLQGNIRVYVGSQRNQLRKEANEIPLKGWNVAQKQESFIREFTPRLKRFLASLQLATHVFHFDRNQFVTAEDLNTTVARSFGSRQGIKEGLNPEAIEAMRSSDETEFARIVEAALPPPPNDYSIEML